MNENFNRTDRQRGAALIVGLVLMTVLTLLAVSTMRTSTLELAMAGNAQYHEQATQLAETGIEDAISRIDNDEIIPPAIDGWLQNFSEVVEADGGGNLGRYDVTISYTGSGTVIVDNSEFEGFFYEIESTGTSAARNAKSTLIQGFYMR